MLEVNSDRPPIRVAAILLGAGASSRMGRPKLLLPWGTESVVGHLIQQWTQAGAGQVAVVCAPGNPAMETELQRLGFPSRNQIVNPQPERGMFSSIRSAAQWRGWQAQLTHWAVVLGDQPHLPMQTLRHVLQFAAERPGRICQPSRHGRPRHPVILPRPVFRALAESQHESLRDFLQTWSGETSLCEIDDPALEIDLDTPADYEAALKAFLCEPGSREF